MIKFQPQVESFQEALRRLVELQGKTMKEVILDQAALFVRDGIRLLPPFGKTPLKEPDRTQRVVGETATRRDVNRSFNTLDKPEINSKLREAFLKQARKGNFITAERLVKRFKFRSVASVITEATHDIHNTKRNHKGRVPKKSPQYFVFKKNSITRLSGKLEKLVGRAKAGFLYALEQINAMRGKATYKAPSWVRRHPSEPGTFVNVGSDDQFGITASNAVPFAQKHAERVQREGWTARMIAAPRQADAIYRGMLRKARQLKL